MKVLFIAVVLSFLALHSSEGAEPWADDRLHVRDGMVAWFDASAQNGARTLHGEPALTAGDPVATWYDASGNGYDLARQDVISRPTIHLAPPHALVRFDGQKQSLSAYGLKESFDEVTVFIVAAPVSNDGGYSALIGMNAEKQQDYTSGLNIDQGPYPSSAFDTINVEGAGATGVRDLKKSASPLLRLERLCVTSKVGKDGVTLYVNGEREGSRERAPSTIGMDQLVVGARYFGIPPEIHGFFTGEIAEVIIFDHVLSDVDRNSVDEYLAAKYEGAAPVPPLPVPLGAKALAKVGDPSPIQMFVPGFTARALPIELPNINNVLYRADGKLIALGYNGNVYVLTDSDGDGLEDQVSLYWENDGRISSPIGMDLTPPAYERGPGVFITSKSNCILVVDTDGDDVADEEITVAEGWPVTTHGVDALGVAIDPRDGSVFFGIGTQSFVNGYLKDKDGKAQYSLDGDRGTIQRVSPDFQSRRTVATGIRFPVAIRFNKAGDLFCTDQEGATWLANGNPFDELLQIDLDRTRHYGFPPRHPRHLPKVIDEPSVFDYRPQHQSTCGLNFNENMHHWPIFGPPWWEGDAIVTGYSRGKLFRTKLVKTTSGYVAENQTIGVVQALAADACVGPGGELVIATHSGGPDWGSGPSGTGKLFKVNYAKSDVPIPVTTWARTPYEVRVAFDRALDPREVATWKSRISIDCGQSVAAGDRFETLRPGYAIVVQQVKSPRYDVEVTDATLTPDHRTLVLSTAPHRAAIEYSMTLPAPKKEVHKAEPAHLPQLPEIDLAYDLSGVETRWQPDSVDLPWHGWLPHLDLAAARGLTIASAEHKELWRLLDQPGTLTLRTQLRLQQMLRPQVQPGERLDFEYPPEVTTVVFESNCPLEINLDGDPIRVVHVGPVWTAEFSRPSSNRTEHQLEVRLKHEHQSPRPSLSVSYHTNEDPTPRALALRRMVMPWAPVSDEAPMIVNNQDLAELEGGDWLRGKEIFFGDQALCSRCHQMRGEGGKIGPDLSNLPQRDYESVLRDITKPSYAINPDFLTQTLLLASGQVLTGSVRSEGEKLLIGDKDGKETVVSLDDVDEIHASSMSIMPEGIPELLGPKKLRDLLTFLLVEPPHMTEYGALAPPPPRSVDEVEAVLAGAPNVTSTRPLHLVLVAGRKDHGPGEHDYPAWQTVWERLLAMAEDTTVTTATDWPSAGDLESADVLVFYQQGTWTPDRARDIDAFLKRGGGLVYIHYAVDGGQDAPGFAKRIGLAWKGGHSKFRHGPLDVDFSPGENHPIARNFDQVHFHDESYWNLVGDDAQIRLLGTGIEEKAEQPLFWTATTAKGRVFVSIPGHFSWTFDDPLFRTLLLRGIAWSAGEPVDRFNELVTPGARIRR